MLSRKRITKTVIRLGGCAGRSVSLLFTYMYDIDRFYHEMLQIEIQLRSMFYNATV